MSTAALTRTVTVNAAFLQEIKEVHQELWGLLSQCACFEAPGYAAWRPWIEYVNSLRDLRDKLALHFALEEAFGYFEDPICVSPQVAQRAANLRAEHTALYVDISALVEQADDLMYERHLEHLLQTIPPGFARFHQRLQEHEDNERELIQAAFSVDLGEGD